MPHVTLVQGSGRIYSCVCGGGLIKTRESLSVTTELGYELFVVVVVSYYK